MKHYPFVAALLLGGCGTTDSKESAEIEASACFMCWQFKLTQEAEIHKEEKEQDMPHERQEVGP